MLVPTYCNSCADRPGCTELCEAAQKYVDQDKVSLKEKLVANRLEYGDSPWTSNIAEPQKRFSLREKTAIALTVCKFKRYEICKVLRITTRQLTVLLQHAKEKMR